MTRKQLLLKYKQTLQPMGVYRVTNVNNGKMFIAGGLNLHGKINSCRFQLIHGSHMNRELQADFTRTGAEHFVFDILDYLEPKNSHETDYTDDLEMLTNLWIEKLQPFGDKGYHKR